MFPDAALLPMFFPGYRVHLGTLIAVLIPFVIWFVLIRTRFGFQIRVFGSAPLAARHAGIGSTQMVWATLLVGGGLAGLAGVLEAIFVSMKTLIPSLVRVNLKAMKRRW